MAWLQQQVFSMHFLAALYCVLHSNTGMPVAFLVMPSRRRNLRIKTTRKHTYLHLPDLHKNWHGTQNVSQELLQHHHGHARNEPGHCGQCCQQAVSARP
ncbi:hypothetical protein B0J12DRAFT_663758 [Macrophomina phaseolina]|uniref:Secreted protein n=1 Tax=Macrophomina phaseolina TaxID=35725 RepID=A0ABQ8GAY7_9PEZI|nr:hypothetical protein B0J12DRAFT_663758 [Macrophomina phaseolina]